jgi:hypothetical protein
MKDSTTTDELLRDALAALAVIGVIMVPAFIVQVIL